MDIDELLARQEITELLTRYTRAIDTRTFDDLDDVFTAEAILDYTTVGGPREARDPVKAWLEKGLAGFDRFQHVLGQVQITFDPAPGAPTAARATAYFTNPMIGKNPDGTETLWEFGGYYHHTLERTRDGWRSVALVEEIVWTR